VDRVAADGERDRFFSAQEAFEYGLVDEVAEFPAAKAGDSNDKSEG
jgi:ATP-dependent protease ClpP protease subunit